MPNYYFNNTASGNTAWELLTNWWTVGNGTGSNPATVPWATAATATSSLLSGAGNPTINAATIIGIGNASFRITGNCSIGNITNAGTIYDGNFTAAPFTNSGTVSTNASINFAGFTNTGNVSVSFNVPDVGNVTASKTFGNGQTGTGVAQKALDATTIQASAAQIYGNIALGSNTIIGSLTFTGAYPVAQNFSQTISATNSAYTAGADIVMVSSNGQLSLRITAPSGGNATFQVWGKMDAGDSTGTLLFDSTTACQPPVAPGIPLMPLAAVLSAGIVPASTSANFNITLARPMYAYFIKAKHDGTGTLNVGAAGTI
jgi:hypothetical protein